MHRLKFFDLKTRKIFMTDKFKIVNKNGRLFAVAKAPSGINSRRLVGKEFAKKNK